LAILEEMRKARREARRVAQERDAQAALRRAKVADDVASRQTTGRVSAVRHWEEQRRKLRVYTFPV
jgi:hypothetical protein